MLRGLHCVVRWLCALSLVLAVFAHRPVLTTDLETDALPYAWATDDVLPLCLPSASHGSDSQQKASKGCEYCRVAGAVMFPEPIQVADAGYRYPVRPDFVSTAAHPRKSAWQRAALPRGPPYA